MLVTPIAHHPRDSACARSSSPSAAVAHAPSMAASRRANAAATIRTIRGAMTARLGRDA